jgi:hypothetical protein
MPNVTLDRSLLEAALSGLQARRAVLEGQIAAVRRSIQAAGPAQQSSPAEVAERNGNVAGQQASGTQRSGASWTPARRRRMAESMKRRWADGSIQRALKRAKR